MNYQVTINGQLFNVTVQAAGQASAVPAATPIVSAAPSAVATGVLEEQVVSPMPGSIWQVKVAIGDRVAAGQALIVLEAMKMENDIVAPRDGVVKQILVTKGTVVETNDVLVVLS